MMKRLELSAYQLDVLATPIRQDLIGALYLLKEASVPELARFLNRKPKGIYYHTEALMEAGLIEVAELRPSARRMEKVYRLVAESIRISYRDEPEYRAAAEKSVRATMRLTEREAINSIFAEPKSVLERTTANLPIAKLEELTEKLMELKRWIRENESTEEGIRVGVTFSVATRPANIRPSPPASV